MEELRKMPGKLNIDKTISVRELLERYPQATKVFIKRGFACVGCYGEGFHTLEDVARIYEIDVQELLDQLNKDVNS